ncbi:MAG: hypothetical protein ABIV13_00980 [Fimbriimonadales bacterium]
MAKSPLTLLLVLLGVFWVLWVTNAYIRIPLSALSVANVIVTVIFVAMPIVIIAAAARLKWKPVVTVAVCAACLAAVILLRGGGPVLDGVVQIARFGWPAAIGFLITGLIKDKNLLLPIAIVLATVDILAVFAPAGTVQQGLESPTIRPIFDAMAYQVPEAGTARPLAQMGPADPLFIAMFLYAVRKFKMRFKETLLWLIPSLAIYLWIVLAYGDRTWLGFSLGALPALVPIGLVVALVNAREFKMSRQEAMMTIGVATLCAGLIFMLLTVWRG